MLPIAYTTRGGLSTFEAINIAVESTGLRFARTYWGARGRITARFEPIRYAFDGPEARRKLRSALRSSPFRAVRDFAETVDVFEITERAIPCPETIRYFPFAGSAVR